MSTRSSSAPIHREGRISNPHCEKPPTGDARGFNDGRKVMARIKHIALVTDDPAKTAEFYKEHFGLTELYRRPVDTGDKGV
ncbi:MAG: VOC family protein, partial [Alphaproteobacteria bacterium]